MILGKALVVSNPDLSLLPQITDRPFFIRTALNGTNSFGSGACPSTDGEPTKERDYLFFGKKSREEKKLNDSKIFAQDWDPEGSEQESNAAGR